VIQLIKQLNGNSMGLAIKGDNEKEIEQYYFLLWNHEVTSAELNWHGPSFAYITSSPEAVLRGLTNICLNRLLQDENNSTAYFRALRIERRGIKALESSALWMQAAKMASDWLESLPSENFLQDYAEYVPDGYGYGKYEGLSSWSDKKEINEVEPVVCLSSAPRKGTVFVGDDGQTYPVQSY